MIGSGFSVDLGGGVGLLSDRSGGPYLPYLAQCVNRALVTFLILFAALPLLFLDKIDIEPPAGTRPTGASLAEAAFHQRTALNAQETADETNARQAVLNYQACASGPSLIHEIGFANSLGRIDSWGWYAGTYTEELGSNDPRVAVHIVFRSGLGDEPGQENEYVFVYDSSTQTVSAPNQTASSYLRELQHECASLSVSSPLGPAG